MFLTYEERMSRLGLYSTKIGRMREDLIEEDIFSSESERIFGIIFPENAESGIIAHIQRGDHQVFPLLARQGIWEDRGKETEGRMD